MANSLYGERWKLLKVHCSEHLIASWAGDSCPLAYSPQSTANTDGDHTFADMVIKQFTAQNKECDLMIRIDERIGDTFPVSSPKRP